MIATRADVGRSCEELQLAEVRKLETGKGVLARQDVRLASRHAKYLNSNALAVRYHTR